MILLQKKNNQKRLRRLVNNQRCILDTNLQIMRPGDESPSLRRTYRYRFFFTRKSDVENFNKWARGVFKKCENLT
jgi:hypothetical protein